MGQPDLPQRLIAYFRDCLEAETRRAGSGDLFSRGQRDHLFFPLPAPTAPETLQATRVVNLDVAADALQRLSELQQLHQQDYQLNIGLFPLALMSEDDDGRPQELRAPLLIASINTPLDQVRFDTVGFVINPLLEDALEPGPTSATGSVIQTCYDFLRQHGLQHIGIPSERQLRATANAGPAWYDSGVLWLSRRSQMGRSVIHELSQLSSPGTLLSAPLAQLLGQRGQQTPPNAQSRPEQLPTSLTDAQRMVLQRGASETISVVNGPPGTGKTFTLACLVFDAVVHQRSALVVCANDHAADVLHARITELFGSASGLVLRPGRGSYRQEFLDRLDHWLSGEYQHTALPPAELKQLAKRVATESRQAARAEKRFARALRAAEHSGQGRAGSRFAQWWARQRTQRSTLASAHWNHLQQTLLTQQQAVAEFLEARLNANLAWLLDTHRDALASLSTAMRSRASHRRQERFDAMDWRLMTSVFPVWVVSATHLSDSVPAQSGLFDLVIMDEATQCSLPLALPALQRGQRAVIVGDPRQLRHFSFVSQDEQNTLAQRHGLGASPINLDYRNNALLDYALSGVSQRQAITFLDEHFRSHPQLIEFSNHTFYEQRIKILTQANPQQQQPPLTIVQVPRTGEGPYNKAEVDTLLDTLIALVRDHKQTAPEDCPSIGIVAMLRATAVALEQGLLKRLTLADIARHRIHIGTPFAFQGEERDIILLAASAWPGQSGAARRYITRNDVFNVAITRARHKQWVFVAEGVMEETQESLLHHYLHFANRPWQPNDARPALGDPDLGALQHWLGTLGANCQTFATIAGQTVDLLVTLGARRLAIDLLGPLHAHCTVGKAWSFSRYRLLERSGIMLFPLARMHWHRRQDEVRQALLSQLGLLDDAPPLAVAGPSAPCPLWQQVNRITLPAPVDGNSSPDLRELYLSLQRANQWVERLIDQQFQAGELTHQRYSNSRIRLHAAAEEQLRGACQVLDDIYGLQLEGSITANVHAYLQDCQQAVDALLKLGEQLSSLRRDSHQVQDAIAELQQLTDRVELYRQ